MQKPNKHFIMDILFDLAKGNTFLLSDIARSLEEPIDCIQTIKRLSSRLEKFHGLKAYMMRWRIEEMFRVQKNAFKLESIRVRSLKKLNRLFFLVFMSLKIEKENIFFYTIE